MDLIKQFMKMGGFKTPEELEAYGEDNFFNDHPEARELAKGALGGTPEAFNMSMPADKFFSYGVPVPPTYHEEGGSLTNRMVYPQIQSADQFFSPVYSNSHNAYAAGGNVEAFPQAVSYPQHGPGKTNYYMPFQKGGTFPPGMPQYTGMLPVMQTGAATDGVLARTKDDNYHYGITPMAEGGEQTASGGMPLSRSQKFIETIQQLALKPYMKDLQEKMAQGGFPSFSPQDEEMGEPGAKYGGYPLRRFQGDEGPSSVPGSGVLLPEVLKDANSDLLFKQLDQAANQNQAQATSQQAAQQAVNQQAAQDAQKAQQSQQAAVNADANTIANAKKMGWGSDVSGYINSGYKFGPGPNIYTTPKKNPKTTNKKSTTGTNTAAPAAAANTVTTGTNTGTTTTGTTTGTTGTTGTGTGTTGNTSTTTTNPGATTTQSNQWIKTVDPWGREGMINPETHQMYYPSGSQGSSDNYDYGYGNDYGYGDNYGYGYNPMWLMEGYRNPDRFWSREDARVFREAIAPRLSDPNTQIEITPEYRKALFKKNRNKELKSATISLTTQPTSRQSPAAQAPIIQDPGPMPTTPWKGQNQASAMVSPEMIAAMNKGAVTESGPMINSQTGVTSLGPSYNRQVLSSNPYEGIEVGAIPPTVNSPYNSAAPAAPVAPAPQSWNPAFDEMGSYGQISNNERNFFGTKSVMEPITKQSSPDWRTYNLNNTNALGVNRAELAGYGSAPEVKAKFDTLLKNNPTKATQWESFTDMPAPLKAIAQDQLFNSSSDPRIFTLAAAGVDNGYTGNGDPVMSNFEYRQWLKKNADTLWKDNKDLILQQYNDDPRAFTSTVSDYRDILYQRQRSANLKPDSLPADPNYVLGPNGEILTDLRSNTNMPGTQYNAWHGRTGSTQDYVDQAYFGAGTGYVAPQFFQQRYGGPFALPMYVTGGPGSVLDDNPFGGTEVMAQPNPEQNMYWNTGNMDQINKTARDIEKKNNPLGKVYKMDLEGEQPGEKYNSKLKIDKKKNKLGADAMLFGLNLGTSVANKFAGNQENQDFSSALSYHGAPQREGFRGSWVTDTPGAGSDFRIDQQNWNMRGLSAPGYRQSATGGQQVANMGSDQYYLTQEQINKVIKAGGRVPGF